MWMSNWNGVTKKRPGPEKFTRQITPNISERDNSNLKWTFPGTRKKRKMTQLILCD